MEDNEEGEKKEEEEEEKESEKDMRSIYVPEVSLEERMHFYKFPRLGAYMGVLLEMKKKLLEKELIGAVE